MNILLGSRRLNFCVFAVFTALVSGCTSADTQGGSGGAGLRAQQMPGCGMMVDGKMVESRYAPPECMTMNKPGNMMPHGVTMHPGPR